MPQAYADPRRRVKAAGSGSPSAQVPSRTEDRVRAQGLARCADPSRWLRNLKLVRRRFGLHLHGDAGTKYSTPLSDVKIWFQLKGVHASTLTAEQLNAAETVAVEVKLDHLKFWYAQPEAVHMVVHLEATDQFLLEDVRDFVDRTWGNTFLALTTFAEGQKTVTIHVRRDALLTEERLSQLLAHRSMRIDGPQWRGRPLGHRFDPLRSAVQPMEPADYRQMVVRLLEVHGYEELESLDPGLLLGAKRLATDRASLSFGRMHHTYEWTHPIFTEFGYGPGETFRIEGELLHVQGKCAVLIHEQVESTPQQEIFAATAKELRDHHGVKYLLAFINQAHSPELFGSYKISAEPLLCIRKIWTASHTTF
jgi:hypothetical protein